MKKRSGVLDRTDAGAVCRPLYLQEDGIYHSPAPAETEAHQLSSPRGTGRNLFFLSLTRSDRHRARLQQGPASARGCRADSGTVTQSSAGRGGGWDAAATPRARARARRTGGGAGAREPDARRRPPRRRLGARLFALSGRGLSAAIRGSALASSPPGLSEGRGKMADKAPGGSQKGSGKVRPFRGAARGPAARSAAGGCNGRDPPAGRRGSGAAGRRRGLPSPCVPAPAPLLRGGTAARPGRGGKRAVRRGRGPSHRGASARRRAAGF